MHEQFVAGVNQKHFNYIYITDTMASYRIEFHQFISEGQIAKKNKKKKPHNKNYKKE